MIYDLQKASFLKRISAFLLDFVLLATIACFFAFIISAITNYTGLNEEFLRYYTKYEQIYDINLTDGNLIVTYTGEQKELYDTAMRAMNADPDVRRCWDLVRTLPIVMVSVGIFLSTLIVEFVIPLFLKNGQTVGKKVFKIGVINSNGVICTNFQLFARALLGKCAVEYMIPGIIIVMMCLGSIGIVGPLVLLALLAIQIIVFAMNGNRPFIHDLVASTAVCDLSTQKVFGSYAEMIEFKEKINKQEAEKAIY